MIRPFVSLGTPLIEDVRPTPWLQTNSQLDAVAPYGMRMNLRRGYLADLASDPVDVLVRHAEEAASIEGSATTINLWSLGGAISEDTPEDAVAFSRTGASWLWETVHMWNDAALDGALDGIAADVTEKIAPYSLRNGYSNLSDDRGEEWRRGSSAATRSTSVSAPSSRRGTRRTCCATTRTSLPWTARAQRFRRPVCDVPALASVLGVSLAAAARIERCG